MNGYTKNAIITGGSRGIGAAIAERLAADGINVVVNYVSDPGEADRLIERIAKAGGQAVAVQADVADPDAVARMFDATETAFGGVDILVNNAGVMYMADLSEADDQHFDQQIAVNLKGVFNGLREGARRVRAGGRIVNFSSSAVGLYEPGYAVYCATKAAVEAMTHVLAKEMRGRNITVNAIAPGPTATSSFMRTKSEYALSSLCMLAPLERLGQPQDIANTVAFLAGSDGAWINGQVLRVNGGAI